MSEGVELEKTARRRLRSLRQARGWTLDDLAARAHVGASTISRIETGRRRLALDQLVTLARALGVTVDDLLTDGDGDDVVIRPTPRGDGGAMWMLSRRDDPSGRVVAKMRVPAGGATEPERQVHPGHDWFYVLDGRIRLTLGDRTIVVEAGEAAEFSTMTPHAIDAVDAPAELIMVFDRDGQRAHLHTEG